MVTTDDDDIWSDHEPSLQANRSRKRARASTAGSTRRVLLVGKDVSFHRPLEIAGARLAPYTAPHAGKLILGILEVSWAVSEDGSCTDDARLAHDAWRGSVPKARADAALTYVDYKVERAGFVPEAPWRPGQIAQVAEISVELSGR